MEESGERVLGPARLNAVFSGTAFSQTRTEIGAVAPIYRTTHEVRSLRFLNIKIDRLHIPGFRRGDHFNFPESSNYCLLILVEISLSEGQKIKQFQDGS